MEEIRNRAKQLLESKEVDVIIGYGEGYAKKVKAVFIRKIEDVNKLVFDERCTQNISVYLTKHEVKHFGKAGIVATIPTMRSVLQLASESQLEEEKVRVLGITKEGKFLDFPNFKTIETFLQKEDLSIPQAERELMDKIEAMSVVERWEFWQKELSKCIKCYACRSSCPMCYCNRCMVDCNQPQWVTVPSTEIGNVEWHLMRAMHLAGRCVTCGECGRACPVEIPIHLLTFKMSEEAQKEFGAIAGLSATMDSTLSSYKPNDKENFII